MHTNTLSFFLRGNAGLFDTSLIALPDIIGRSIMREVNMSALVIVLLIPAVSLISFGLTICVLLLRDKRREDMMQRQREAMDAEMWARIDRGMESEEDG